MIEGKCPHCGLQTFGWALLSPRYQTCPNCGIGLEITEDNHPMIQGFSPFTAERMDINENANNLTVKNHNKAT
jgi:hypothetical protein